MGRVASSQVPPTHDTPLLDVRDLTVRFDTYDGTVRALEGVSYHVRRGEVFGLVGETGCGKSVSAYAVLRLLPRTARIARGTVTFDGEELTTASERRLREIRGRDIAMVFQDPLAALNPVMRAGKQVAEVLRLHQRQELLEAAEAFEGSRRSRYRQAVRARVEDALRQVKLPDPASIADAYPHELSGGMQQRVMIAMALACRPRLLIADEPTTALDVTIQAQVLRLLRELQGELGMSVLLITHDLGVVAGMCDRVAVMYAGTIVEQASVAELFADPRHPYTQGLLAALPSGDARLTTIPGRVPDLIAPPEGCRFHPRCPRATKRCAREAPELREAGARKIACHEVQMPPDDTAPHAAGEARA